jgi:phosphate transport system substrate-binding protein
MKTWIALLAASSALVLSCKKGDNGGDNAKLTEKGSAATKVESNGPVSLSASGSTFQKAFQENSMDAYMKNHSNVKLTYGGGGSGKGRQDLADMVVDFAGTDSAYKDEDKAKIKGGDVLYFPILLGPISVSYNVEGAEHLNLSAETLAKIMQGDIKKWNDAAIVADNKTAKLPSDDIVVVHRADGSGTTDNFTKYLDKASGGTWKLKSGSTVNWPPNEQAGQGNGGVATIIKSTKGAIGYVDLSDAKAAGLHYANVKNQAGKFVEPTSETASAAADGIDIKDDLTFSALDSKGDAAYPITYQSWVIVYAKQADKNKGDAVKAYLDYLLGDAQKDLAALDFAPLPKGLHDKAVAQLAKIQ